MLLLLALGVLLAQRAGAWCWVLLLAVLLGVTTAVLVHLSWVVTPHLAELGDMQEWTAQYLLLGISLLGWALGVTLRRFRSGSRADSAAPH